MMVETVRVPLVIEFQLAKDGQYYVQYRRNWDLGYTVEGPMSAQTAIDRALSLMEIVR